MAISTTNDTKQTCDKNQYNCIRLLMFNNLMRFHDVQSEYDRKRRSKQKLIDVRSRMGEFLKERVRARECKQKLVFFLAALCWLDVAVVLYHSQIRTAIEFAEMRKKKRQA